MKQNKPVLVYLIGAPGSGKSTLARALFVGVPGEPRSKQFAHVIRPGGIELGAQRESFSGTDALGMSVQPLVLPFLSESGARVVFGEGDRLGNEKFFLSAAAEGWRTEIVLLDTPAEVSAARRRARGSAQSPAWVRGRETKVARLSYWARVRLDGTRPPLELATTLWEMIPELQMLISGGSE
jgi:energy-coupling factor transporter ATP-binding protein EcfA2